jgi:hypothetical protein
MRKRMKKVNWWSGTSVKHLPSKCEALSSNPTTAKKKKSERERTVKVISPSPTTKLDF